MSEEVVCQWENNRRYNSYADWIAAHFGGRAQKVSVNAGFTCPNRDGTLGYGGCTYCSNEAFIPAYCTPDKTVTQQIDQGVWFHSHRYRRTQSYLAYFQAYTSSYAGIKELISLYGEALRHPRVKGLIIGTRPDCVNSELLDELASMAENSFIMVEFGLESVNDETLKRINRGHNYEASVRAVEDTAARGIPAGAHLIFGLPGESRDQLVASAGVISQLPLTSIKIRQLQLIKGTGMADEYKRRPDEFDLYTLDEYLDLVISFVERLDPRILIDRISGEAPQSMLVSPDRWGVRSSEVIELFEARLRKENRWQGKKFKSS